MAMVRIWLRFWPSKPGLRNSQSFGGRPEVGARAAARHDELIAHLGGPRHGGNAEPQEDRNLA
jgi:hypothetical protein